MKNTKSNAEKILALCKDKPDLTHEVAELVLLLQGYHLAPSTARLADFLAREQHA